MLFNSQSFLKAAAFSFSAYLLPLGILYFNPALASAKTETEIGFKISPDFANKILGAFEFKHNQRTDYYIEAYDGESFLLHPDPRGLKFRMQVETDENTLQAMVEAKKTPATCPEGFNFFIKEQKVGELSVTDAEMSRFTKGVKAELQALAEQNAQEYSSLAAGFHSYLSSIQFSELAQLKKMLPASDQWLFVASHVSKKTKWKTKEDLGKGKIAISVTRGKEYVGATLVEETFEVEFEARENMTKKDFADSVCLFLKQMQPQNSDLSPTRQLPWQHSLKLLNQLRPQLPLNRF